MNTHGHFAHTPYIIRPYSVAGIPFRWMLREQVEGNKKWGVSSLKEALPADALTKAVLTLATDVDAWVIYCALLKPDHIAGGRAPVYAVNRANLDRIAETVFDRLESSDERRSGTSAEGDSTERTASACKAADPAR